MRQDFAELGRRCLQQLLAVLDGCPDSDGVTILPELVVRRSTAPVPPR